MVVAQQISPDAREFADLCYQAWDDPSGQGPDQSPANSVDPAGDSGQPSAVSSVYAEAISHPMLVPFLAVATLLVTIPLFFRQSFLQLSDVTAASVTLAVVTAFLPAAMLIGLSIQLRRRRGSAIEIVDLLATAAVLQLTMVLVAWNLVPLRLWV
jgi:uncharacterized protein (TIGR03382 family)